MPEPIVEFAHHNLHQSKIDCYLLQSSIASSMTIAQLEIWAVNKDERQSFGLIVYVKSGNHLLCRCSLSFTFLVHSRAEPLRYEASNAKCTDFPPPPPTITVILVTRRGNTQQLFAPLVWPRTGRSLTSLCQCDVWSLKATFPANKLSSRFIVISFFPSFAYFPDNSKGESEKEAAWRKSEKKHGKRAHRKCRLTWLFGCFSLAQA